MLVPAVVKLMPPVVGWFDGVTLEILSASYETAEDIDPETTPKLSTKRKLPCTPAAVFASTKVSETHTVARAADPCTRAATLKRRLPKSDPLMLMLPAIVPMFTGETLNSMLTSYDMSDEIDLVTKPVVTTNLMLPCVPAAIFPVTEVSDAQMVDCPAVKPARAAML